MKRSWKVVALAALLLGLVAMLAVHRSRAGGDGESSAPPPAGGSAARQRAADSPVGNRAGGAVAAPAPPSADAWQTKHYEVVHGDPGEQPEMRLCDLLSDPGVQYGVYRVTALVGRTERSEELGGAPTGVTYVYLARVEGSGPVNPVAKVAGGPLPDGTDFFGAVRLQVDETVGLILRPGEAPGQYTLEGLDVFHEGAGGRLGNSQLEFTSAREFLASADRERSGCTPAADRALPINPADAKVIVIDQDDTELVGQSEPVHEG